MTSELDQIRINYGLNGAKEPVVVLAFNAPVDGVVLSSMEARSLAKHLYDAALNAELTQSNSRSAIKP
jgi:methylmalonyl-CoA mutase cobalamin-binding subunit